MKQIVSGKGIPIEYHSMPNTHSVTVGLYVKAGVLYEEENLTGITHMLEHMCFRKLNSMNQKELYYKMESIGGSLQGTTYRDFLMFSMKVIPENFEACWDIICEIIETDRWSDEDFNKEKQVVLNQILERDYYISESKDIRRVLFEDHKLRHEIMGSVESVENMSLKDVLKYKYEVFNPSNMKIFITGNISEVQFKNAIKKIENIEFRYDYLETVVEIPKFFYNRKEHVINYFTSNDLLHINISFDIKCKKTEKKLVDILNCILGEGIGSRLQLRIREECGYTSNIYSYVEWYSKFAVLHINCLVEKENLIPCIKETIHIINDLKTGIMITDLDVSLPFYTYNKQFLKDDTEEFNFVLAYNSFVLEKEDSTNELKSEKNTITLLENIAKKIFLKQNLCIIIFGDIEDADKKVIEKFIEIL